MDKEKEELRNEYALELNDLKNWFDWYDTQVMQYQRDLRLNGSSTIDLISLDALALKNATRIKELKELIEETYRED